MGAKKAIFGLATACVATIASNAHANDWEKFYRPLMAVTPAPLSQPPEVVPSSGNADADVERMWRNGFAPIGFSSFNSNNAKTGDAMRFAKKISARYVVLATRLASSTSSAIPMTTPTTTTSVTNGSVSAQGTGGYASGTYNGTTTTYGSQTSYIPITINRFDKLAVYFAEAPKAGLGVMGRDLTPQEIATLETRRALPVRFVRDGSPAYVSDLLPGDIIIRVDGKPFDKATLDESIEGRKPFPVTIYRGGNLRVLTITIPADWGTATNR